MAKLIAELVAAIKRSGLTQQEIAKRSGVSHSMISKLVNGDRPDLSTDRFEKVANVVGLQITVRRRKRR